MYLELTQIKKHLNIDPEFHDDDSYLMDLATAAENIVQQNIDRPLSDTVDGGGNIPSPLVHAMLLLVGNYYANRESVTFGAATALPHAYEYIIKLYKNFNGPKEGVSPI